MLDLETYTVPRAQSLFLNEVDRLFDASVLSCENVSEEDIANAIWLIERYNISSAYFRQPHSALVELALARTIGNNRNIKDETVHRLQLYLTFTAVKNYSQTPLLEEENYYVFNTNSSEHWIRLEDDAINELPYKYAGYREHDNKRMLDKYMKGKLFPKVLINLGLTRPLANVRFQIIPNVAADTLDFRASVLNHLIDPIVLIGERYKNNKPILRHEVTHLQTRHSNFIGGPAYIEAVTDHISGTTSYSDEFEVVYCLSKILDQVFPDRDHLYMQLESMNDVNTYHEFQRRFIHTFGMEGILLLHTIQPFYLNANFKLPKVMSNHKLVMQRLKDLAASSL